MSITAAEWPEAEQRIAEVARTRRGRHRDKALASYRRTRALELRALGKSYAEIAAAVGYAHKGTAHKVISQALAAREAESIDMLRNLELARLDALQLGVWDKALTGDLAAVHAALRISDARVRLLGLYELPPGSATGQAKNGWDNCQGPPTVIVRGDDCRHQGCHKHGNFIT